MRLLVKRPLHFNTPVLQNLKTMPRSGPEESSAASSADATARNPYPGSQDISTAAASHAESNTSMKEDNTENSQMIRAMFAHCGYESDELEQAMEVERDAVISTKVLQAVPKPPESMLNQAIQGMQDALVQMDPQERKDYDLAMQLSPEIVRLETPFDRFLMSTNYNYWEAAQRLTLYWARRREIFGDEFFAKGMNLIGEGAISPELVEGIKQGSHMILPQADQWNRPIMLVDRENSNDTIDENRLKTCWYFLHVLFMESDIAVVHGFVKCHAGEARARKAFKPDGSVAKLIDSGVVPVKPLSRHALVIWSSAVKHATKAWLSFFRNIGGNKVRVHCFRAPIEAAKRMGKCGFSECHFPPRFGGTANAPLWILGRIRKEEQIYKKLRVSMELDQKKPPALLVGALPGKSTACTSSSSSSSQASAEGEIEISSQTSDTEDSKTRRKSSKRKFRDLLLLTEIHEERTKITKLQKTKLALQEEHNLLLSRLECAQHSLRIYRSDRQVIQKYLMKWLQETKSSEGKHSNEDRDEEADRQVVEHILETEVRFLGRNTTSGIWEFERSPGRCMSSDETESELHKLTKVLVDLQPVLLRDQQMSEAKANSEILQKDYQCSEECVENALKAEICLLQRQNDVRKSEESFLQAATNYSSSLVKLADEFRAKQVEYLTNSLQKLFAQQRKRLGTSRTSDPESVALDYVNGRMGQRENYWLVSGPNFSTLFPITTHLLVASKDDSSALDPSSEIVVSSTLQDEDMATKPSAEVASEGTTRPLGEAERRQQVQKRRKASLKRL